MSSDNIAKYQAISSFSRPTDSSTPRVDHSQNLSGLSLRTLPRPRSPRLIPYLSTPFLLLCALSSAICQHCFYAHFSGHQVDQGVISQVWVIRIGTALAFLFKASMTAAIAGAFCQTSWYCFQNGSTTLGGLDAIFAVLQNPLKFFNRDMVFNKKLLSLFAILAWIMPLSAILSPGSMIGIHRAPYAITLLTSSHDRSNGVSCDEASASGRAHGHRCWFLCQSRGNRVAYPH